MNETGSATNAETEPRAIGWWRAVVDRSSDLLVAYDADANIRYASRSISRILGWEPSDLVGTNGMHIIDPAEQGRMRTVLSAMLDNKPTLKQTFRARHRDGSWRHLEALGANHITDPEVGVLVVSLRDVTERVGAEAAVAQRDQHYRYLVEATPDAVLIHRDAKVIYANRAALVLLGTDDTTDVVGCDISRFFGPRPVSSPAEDFRALGEQALYRVDGQSVEAEFTAVPIMWDGRPSTQVIVRDVTLRRQMDLQLLHQATHDPLTGLPNRSLLMDRLQHATARAVRTRRPFAVLFVDLDRFKVVNDTLGHDVGDQLLAQIAARLVDAVRPGDTVARLGGDEFVVVVEDLLVADTVDVVVERIQNGLSEPFTIRGRDFLINASIGVLVTPEGGEPRALLRDADLAMYTAKTRGRGQAVRFDSSLRARQSRHEELQTRLRAAVDEGQLRVVFQPLVRVSDRTVVAAEALMRWEHPEHGTLLPESFLDVADDAGVLPALGLQVVETACRQLSRWHQMRSGPSTARSMWMSLNASASELMHPDFSATVLEAIERHRLPGPSICLEVSEAALLNDPVRAADALKPAREAGIRLGIDNFGTGYTSLTALRRFSPDFVKIDRGFINGLLDSPSDAATVRAIIQMGHALGVATIAEGVETVEQQHLLTVLGCDLVQGFLFGRPRRGEEFFS